MKRPGPHPWDLINPRRAWFRELRRYLGAPPLTWGAYRHRYAQARAVFNHYADRRELGAAFTETEWCLLRQPFYHRRTLWWDVAWALEAAGPRASVLDWGCGTGEMLVWLHAQNPTWRLRGWDLDSPHYRYCQWRLQQRGQRPIKPRAYDVVVCRETFEHLPDPVATAVTLMRRVKPGGVLAWDFIADHDGGANCATPKARQEVLTLLEAQHEGQRETWRRPA